MLIAEMLRWNGCNLDSLPCIICIDAEHGQAVLLAGTGSNTHLIAVLGKLRVRDAGVSLQVVTILYLFDHLQLVEIKNIALRRVSRNIELIAELLEANPIIVAVLGHDHVEQRKFVTPARWSSLLEKERGDNIVFALADLVEL